jgi:hypothetical protein
MFSLIEWSLKIIIYFWLGVFGIGFVDLAMGLQTRAISTYKRGPLNTVRFTRAMTGREYKHLPI